MATQYSDYSEEEDDSSVYTDDEPVRPPSEEKATGEVVIEKTLSVKDQVKNFAHLRLQDILRPQGFQRPEETPVERTVQPEQYDYSLAYNDLERDEYSDEESEYDHVHDESEDPGDYNQQSGINPHQLLGNLTPDSESSAESDIEPSRMPIFSNRLDPKDLIEREPSIEYQPFLEQSKKSPTPMRNLALTPNIDEAQGNSYYSTTPLSKSPTPMKQEEHPLDEPIFKSSTPLKKSPTPIQRENIFSSTSEERPFHKAPTPMENNQFPKMSSIPVKREVFPPKMDDEFRQEKKQDIQELDLIQPSSRFDRSELLQKSQYESHVVLDKIKLPEINQSHNDVDQILLRNPEPVVLRPKSDITTIVQSTTTHSSKVIEPMKRRFWKPFSSFDKTSTITMQPKKQEKNIYFGDDIFNANPGGATSVSLRRGHSDKQWGFTVHGGKEFGCTPFVSQVIKNSISDQHGVEPGDIIEAICGQSTYSKEAGTIKAEILRAGNELDLIITKNGINLEKIYKLLPKLQEKKAFTPMRSKSLYCGSSRVQRLNPNDQSDPITNTKSLKMLQSQLTNGQYPSSTIEIKGLKGTTQNTFMPSYGQGTYPVRNNRVISNPPSGSNNWTTGSNCFTVKQETMAPATHNSGRHVTIAEPEASVLTSNYVRTQVISNQASIFPAYPANQDCYRIGSQSVPVKPKNQSNLTHHQSLKQPRYHGNAITQITNNNNALAASHYSNYNEQPVIYNTNVLQYQNMTQIPHYPQRIQPKVIQSRPHTSSVQFELYAQR